MKNLNLIIALASFLILTITSCQDDDQMEPEDTFLGTDVPRFSVENDYNVGAFYKFSNWSLSYETSPVVGTYNGASTEQYPFHIKQANQAGIDFFLFDLRSARTGNAHTNDLAIVDRYDTALDAFPIDSIVSYAFNYNFGALGINNNNPVDKISDPENGILDPKEVFFQDDFLAIAGIAAANPNYYRLNDKPVVYINAAHNLAAINSPEVFDRMRQVVSDQFDGMELYIVGVQPQWQPPLRYDFRFVGAVDAVTHQTYMTLNKNNSYERILYFEKMIYGAWSYSQEALGRPEFDLEYIPTISPSINFKLTNAGSNNHVFEKDNNFFREICNSARGATGASKLILVDSFNNWNLGSQIEESVESNVDDTPAYAATFLDILKQEFKVSN